MEAFFNAPGVLPLVIVDRCDVLHSLALQLRLVK